MPKFLEEKLKKHYGANSDIPYKIMNKLGFMRGNKTTAKGCAAEAKHKSNPNVKGESTKEKEVDEIRRSSIKKNINGDTINVKAKLFNTDNLMGHHSHSDAKPISTQDKLMSDEHMRKRKEIDGISNTEARLKEAHKWNAQHEQDHKKARIKTKKLLDAHIAGKFLDHFIKKNKG
jgi:hypothetical protein